MIPPYRNFLSDFHIPLGPSAPNSLPKQTNYTDDLAHIREAMATFAVALNAFQARPYDESLSIELASLFQSQITPIDRSSPFHKTDLIVFKETYSGMRHLNGIVIAEFTALQQYYSGLISGKENIVIQGGPEFRNRIHGNLLKLLTRESGRELIKKITDHKDKAVIITPTTPTFPNTIARWGRSNKEVTIYIGDGPDQLIVRCPRTGKLKPMIYPDYLSLGHELIHALHIFSSSSIEEYKKMRRRVPQFDPACENAEEERTIMSSLLRSPHFSSPPSTPEAFGNFAPSDSPITENILRADFGLLPRVGHKGLSKPPDSQIISDPDVVEYFMQCCHEDLIEEMSHYLQRGIGINAFCTHDPQKRTPLMCAAEGGARDAFNLLLERGSFLGARDANGLTLLHHAIRSEDPDFVESLVLSGLVSVREADLCKKPLIQYTLFSLGDRAEKMIETLLRHGANPLAVSSDGETALHHAAMVKGDAIFNRFLAFGCDPFTPNNKGIKPIHCALIAGNRSVFEQLCTSSAEFYQLTPCGKSLMFFAMWSGEKKTVVRVLELERELQGKFDPPFDMLTQRDHENQLPSAYAFKKAAWEEGQDFILFLLKLEHAFTISRAEFGDYVSLFAVARQDIRRVMLDTIYSNSEFIDQPLCYGEPLLRWAVKEGDLALAEYAIQRGAKVNPEVTRESPTTPLHDAVEENKPDMVLFLLQRGADSHAQNRQGLSPLSLAMEKLARGEALDFNIVETLIQFRASSITAEQHRVFFPSSGFA